MTTYGSILQAAMRLSSQERSELAEALWGTVDEPSDAELLAQMSDVQRAAIARRSAEIDAGTAKCVTWEQMTERAYRAAGHNDDTATIVAVSHPSQDQTYWQNR